MQEKLTEHRLPPDSSSSRSQSLVSAGLVITEVEPLFISAIATMHISVLQQSPEVDAIWSRQTSNLLEIGSNPSMESSKVIGNLSGTVGRSSLLQPSNTPRATLTRVAPSLAPNLTRTHGLSSSTTDLMHKLPGLVPSAAFIPTQYSSKLAPKAPGTQLSAHVPPTSREFHSKARELRDEFPEWVNTNPATSRAKAAAPTARNHP
mmetsp:Transcript_41055/g.162323  ORF Transcript_41055/g.162323 Transcript_41055/m.162323 type:complete len:205 (-) Transcript_41055:62-676(-)